MAARDIRRALSLLPTGSDGPVGVGVVVDAMARIVELARAHPVVVRPRDDDPDLFTLADLRHTQGLLTRAADAVTPLLAGAMEAGWFATRDPSITANWLVSTVAWLVLMLSDVDAHAVLAEIVPPLLAVPSRS